MQGDTPLHYAVKFGQIVIAKELLVVGAKRDATNNQLESPADLLENTEIADKLSSDDIKELKKLLQKPSYWGCPLGRLPVMPLERSRRAQVLFLILFVVIHFTQVFIIEPKLDVWYFMMTTTLIGLKFLMSFIFSSRHDPGFLKLTEDEADETVLVDGTARGKFDMMHLLQVIPAENICPYCKVIKTPRSHHCHICK